MSPPADDPTPPWGSAPVSRPVRASGLPPTWLPQRATPPPRVGAAPLVIAVVVVAVIVVAAGVTFVVVAVRHSSSPQVAARSPGLQPGTVPLIPTTTGAPSGPPTAPTGGAAAAVQIAGYVDQSAHVRAQVSGAISQVESCDLPAAQGEGILEQAVGLRSQALSGLQSVDASGIPEGAQIVQQLAQALTSSSAADQSYQAWMVDFANQASPCHTDPGTDANFRAGDAASQQATVAKEAFVAAWDPVAPMYQLPAYQATDL